MSTEKPPQSELEDAAPHYRGHRDRLRRRFREGGADALPDYELLELILFRAIPRQNVKGLAKALIRRFGSFAEVVAAPPALLMETKGIKEAAVTEIKLVEAAARRFAKGEIAQKPVLGSWAPKSWIIAAPRWRSRTANNSASSFSTTGMR